MARKLVYKTPDGFARCTDNDLELNVDGGRCVITASDQFRPSDSDITMNDDQRVQQAFVVINFRRDKELEQFPTTRDQKAARRFTIEVYEEEVDSTGVLIPDPASPRFTFAQTAATDAAAAAAKAP